MKDIKKKSVQGVAWVFLGRAGSQGIGFLITIFLARLISPAEFGLVAMASVFIAITRIFIDSGLRDSLIQKQDCTQVDYNTVFFFNLMVSVALFVLIFLTAPFIANFFGYKELTPIIQVLGLKPFFYSFSIVQTAIIHKELRFSRLAKIQIPAVLISGVAGLVFAWYGYGVWALVIQTILETFLYNIMLWFVSTWRPQFIFDKKIFHFHWKLGSRLLVIGAVGAIYRNIFSLIIGKYFSAAQVGFYSRADSFKTIAHNNTVGLVETVSYPVLAKIQNDHVLLKHTYRKILQTTMFFLLPLVAVTITNANGIIEFLLSAKWLPAAPILVVLMLALTLSPFNSINLNILRVKRRSDLMLRVDIVNKIFLVIIVLITVNLGFDYLVMTNLIIASIALFINNYYTNKLIGYSIRDQFVDMWSVILAFLISVGITLLFKRLMLFDVLIVDLIMTSLVSLLSYLLVIFVVKRDIIFSQVDTIKLLKSRKDAGNNMSVPKRLRMNIDNFLDTIRLRIQENIHTVLSLRDKRTEKSDQSFVTEGDLLINKLIQEIVLAESEEITMVSEESAFHADEPEKGYVVVVDPIDGTENFTSGLPEWGVSVSCYQNGVHVGSLLGCPEMNLWMKSGDSIPTYFSRIRGLSSSLQKEELIKATQGHEYRILGCCVYNMINVIRGSFLSFENPKGAHSWDILGGLNLALENNLKVIVNDKEYSGEYLPAHQKYRFWVGR